jgi:hypothetical protein
MILWPMTTMISMISSQRTRSVSMNTFCKYFPRICIHFTFFAIPFCLIFLFLRRVRPRLPYRIISFFLFPFLLPPHSNGIRFHPPPHTQTRVMTTARVRYFLLSGRTSTVGSWCPLYLDDESNPEPEHAVEELGLGANEHGQVDEDLLHQGPS